MPEAGLPKLPLSAPFYYKSTRIQNPEARLSELMAPFAALPYSLPHSSKRCSSGRATHRDVEPSGNLPWCITSVSQFILSDIFRTFRR